MTEITQPNLDRLHSSTQLVEDFNLVEDAEFFNDPMNRLEFVSSLDFDGFMDVALHVNARVRGFEPNDRLNANDEGGCLPGMRTPDAIEKPIAFHAGFDSIKKYLDESTDSPEQKAKGVGMAMEALIIWVHPFNDGNGRTSRFFGKFIEDGTVNTEELIAETADAGNRLRVYPPRLRLDDMTDLSADILLDDDQILAIKKSQEELPIIEGIAQSITQLLENKSFQDSVEAHTESKRARRELSLAKSALAVTVSSD